MDNRLTWTFVGIAIAVFVLAAGFTIRNVGEQESIYGLKFSPPSEESFYLGSEQDRINLGDIGFPAGNIVDKNDMPIALADGIYTASDQDEFGTSQRIVLSGFRFEHFRDSDYEDLIGADRMTPVLGYHISRGEDIFDYTLDFSPDAESRVVDGRLEDFEGSMLTLAGRPFYVLNAIAGSGSSYIEKLDLVDARKKVRLQEGCFADVNFEGNLYRVSVRFVSPTEVVFTVNGETTDALTEGESYMLSTGDYLTVLDIFYRQFGRKSVEFVIGEGVYEINSGSEMSLNGEIIEGLRGFVYKRTGQNGAMMDKIVLQFNSAEETFITPVFTNAFLPAFGTFGIRMENIVRAEEEPIDVVPSSIVNYDYVYLRAPVLDGTFNLPLVYTNSFGNEIRGIGRASDERLATSKTDTLIYYDRLNGNNYHDNLVVSYSDGINAESYVLAFVSIQQDPVTGRNTTKIRNLVNGVTMSGEYSAGDVVFIGDASFMITDVGVTPSSRWVEIRALPGTRFDVLYTQKGMEIFLPVDCSDGSISCSENGAIFLNNSNGTSPGHSTTEWNLYMVGENKDGEIGQGGLFAIVVGFLNNEIQPLRLESDFASAPLQIDSVPVFESYIYDDVAPRILFYSIAPKHVEVFYPGEETHAMVYLDGSVYTQDEITGQCGVNKRRLEPACITDEQCNDGMFCTVNRCVRGQCVSAQRNCDDGIACTVDSCNEVTDSCVNDNRNCQPGGTFGGSGGLGRRGR